MELIKLHYFFPIYLVLPSFPIVEVSPVQHLDGKDLRPLKDSTINLFGRSYLVKVTVKEHVLCGIILFPHLHKELSFNEMRNQKITRHMINFFAVRDILNVLAHSFLAL